MNEALLAVLFAFAVQHGEYSDYCRNIANDTCRPPATVIVEPSEHVRATLNGWYFNGTAYVKSGRKQEVFQQATTVHEYVHHLQRISGRYHQFRGACNQYGAELEAHTIGNAYLRSKGWSYDVTKAVEKYKVKCYAAVNAGLIKKPDWMK